jgi:hypothetical protein
MATTQKRKTRTSGKTSTRRKAARRPRAMKLDASAPYPDEYTYYVFPAGIAKARRSARTHAARLAIAWCAGFRAHKRRAVRDGRADGISQEENGAVIEVYPPANALRGGMVYQGIVRRRPSGVWYVDTVEM